MSANEPLVREAISQEPAFGRALEAIDAALESRVDEREEAVRRVRVASSS
jgi:hypothetical protein